METMIIRRKLWLHGEGGERSYLLRESDGKLCCLGFRALQQGATRKQIAGIKTPLDLYQRTGIRLKGLVRNKNNTTSTAIDLMGTNDEKTVQTFITDEQREAAIIKLFRKIGVIVKFVGKY